MSTIRLFVAGVRRPPRARRMTTAGVVALCAVALAVPALAAPDNNGKGQGRSNSTVELPGSCWAEGVDHIRADGLPTYQQLNLLVSDSSGTNGWALGETWDGTYYTWVAPRTETTTYQFISVQKGNDGKIYEVFATCTLEP